MGSKEVMDLLDSVSEKLEAAEPSVRNAVENYQALNYDQRKECSQSWKRLGNAFVALGKAFGHKWWRKWGHFVFGWGIGLLCIALPWALGWLKILFEH